MSLQQSYIALDWVKDALDETLKKVQAQLQEQTPLSLQSAYDNLHQVSGTLHIAQLTDILMLSEVLEKVLQAVAVGRLHLSNIKTEIRQALEMLIEELDHLQRTKSSRTALVYEHVDVLNALLLNESAEPKVTFIPDYSLLGEKYSVPPRTQTQQNQLTQAYQYLLGNWFRDETSQQSLVDLSRVADLLHETAQTRQDYALWQVASVFHHAISAGSLSDIALIRPLMIRLERSLVAKKQSGADSHNVLLGDLLRTLDPHVISDPEVSKVRQFYGMDLPEIPHISSRLLDSALQQVNAARVGLSVNRDTAAIALREAVRLLEISGWHPLAKEGQAQLLQLVAKYDNDSKAIALLSAGLMKFADKVQQTIALTSKSNQASDGDFIQDARHAAVRESRTALEKTKSALAKYHQSRGDIAALAAVPDLLKMVSGAFAMLDLPRAAILLSNTTSAIKSTILKAKYVPHWKQTELLAQLISSIEYYLDQLAGQYQDDNILSLAERTLAEFKQPQKVSQPAPAGGEKLYHDETVAAIIDHIDGSEGDTFAKSAALVGTESVVDHSLAQSDTNDNPYNDDFEQDDEIREIFIEEAEEVLETIAEYYPKWKANFADEASLKEMRRGFHTLKGSGRMVGARTVGELSWSIENLLNRVLDHTVQPNKSMTGLIDTVFAGIPDLIESYKLKRTGTPAANQQIATWISEANALMHARIVDVVETSAMDEDDALDAESTSLEITTQDVANSAQQTNIQQANGNQPLPIHLLNDQAPKVMPEDDFVSYFGDDDSILEIFLEEAGEVIQELNEHFPQWAVNFENEAALKVIRRNFHTLKGSGRMVGAHAMAELAWSNERLLNGVLEHTVVPTQNMVQLLGEVISILPSLVEDFSTPREPRIDLLPIVHTAWLLHAGHDISGAQIQNVMQKTVSADSDIPVLDDEQFLLENFDALANAFNDEDANFLPQATVKNPIAATIVAPVATHNAVSIDDLDPQLLEIFISEAEGYLENIRTFVSENLSVASNTVMTNDVLLRALHTLRGSAGMTGIESVYQLAHIMEHEFKRLMREHVAMRDEHLDALIELDRLATLQVKTLQSGQMPSLDAAGYAFIDRVEALAPKKKEGENKDAEPVFTGLVTELMDIGIDDVLDAEWTLKELLSGPNALAHLETLNAQMCKLSQAVVHVPIAPLAALAATLQQTYEHLVKYPALLSEDHAALTDDLWDAHTALTRMFDELAASLQVQPVQAVIERLQDWQKQIPVQQVLSESLLFENLSAPEIVPPKVQVEMTSAVVLSYPVDHENDAELLEVFMEEAEELVQDIDQSFTAWAADSTNNEPLKALQRHLHTLKGGARMARVESLGDYTHELETIYERLVIDSKNTPEVLIRFLRHAQDQVAQQVEQLGQSQTSFYTPTETQILQQYIKSRDNQVLQGYFDLIDNKRTESVAPVVASVEVMQPTPESKTAAESVVVPAIIEQKAVVPEAIVTPEPKQPISALGQMQVLAEAWDEGSAPDPDVLEIFLDEAGEIVDLTSVQLSKWLKGSSQSDDPSNKKLLQDLQRNLHTFKGGARMAGVDSLGDLSHEMEFVYEDLALGKRPVTPEIGVLLNQSHDWLADSIAVLDRGERPQMPQALIDALRLFRKDPALLAATQAKLVSTSAEVKAPQTVEPTKIAAPVTPQVTASKPAAKVTPATLTVISDPSGLPPMTGSFLKSHDLDVSSSEMVRVSATMMEKMINLAGENAISRARIEMELTGFAVTVDEMGTAIQKISEQLRRMDGELESQIIARHHDEVSQHDGGQNQDFDPLEMDQYSSINQLSKSLAESVSDLLDFKNTLVEKSRDSESLLLQQSRIQSELQEGLMSSRLVPFSRLVPRLQRVVRQTATELGKPVELNILNAEGELDRSVLERMVAPLEHMLRNAVDHGMESSADRGLQHKPEKGSITLSVLREGSEVIITLQDDGRGINVDAVRRKAIERGIIEDSAALSDYEIMQLIFHAGLSTASHVTQISGRGVGMDVVQSEIRQLGGVVSVSSVAGQGTCFTLRLPLTVAVTDALRVRVGDRIFAISLSQIERIVRVGNAELENFYQSNKETYAIDGQQYRLRYLGELVGGSHTPILYGQGQDIPSPLLLVKYEGQRFAIQVDQLIGSREEIVIKPVGVQLVTVGSISGATILGDGSVVIILDLVALARSAGSMARMKAASKAELKASTVAVVQKQTIMVVDDSVTVRKVTTRLLERHGYQVIQAKDGVDAMSKLEDTHPDLMLLDIEMPRMDGFEVATLVRHSPRLSYLPIIMITSRTGEKHRERAYSVGVNGYMGKPFQEQMLLENISDLLLASKAEIARNQTTV
jgi:chemosensory pili system protein ChpA (sensor histidine kinase/response regulator)